MLKNVRLKNKSGALLCVDCGRNRGVHFLAGETRSVPASVVETSDVARLVKKGFLAVLDDKPPAAPEIKKGKA